MIIKKLTAFKNSFYSIKVRKYCSKIEVTQDLRKYFLDDLETLEKNILIRNHANNIPLIRILISYLKQELDDEKKNFIRTQLQREFHKLPNYTHPRVIEYGKNTKQLLLHEYLPLNLSKALQFSEICKSLNILRTDHLSNFNGHKSYYLSGFIAELEHVLIQYALKTLNNKRFKLLSVPDILPKQVIENCGMQTQGERTQVYKIDSKRCLSGTSEMSLAGFYENSLFEEVDLPITVAAVSRCYRAETSGLQDEKGIYRVHNFTKVEMFAISSETHSEKIIDEFKDIQIELFKGLGITFKLLDMPPCELGASAYQKYDIEAWMPGRKMWGEISSCSNCTDYQAKRLGIKYRTSNGQIKYAHTINGTAAAIPRLLIALIESHQQIPDGSATILTGGKPWVKSEKFLKKIPELKFVKVIK